MKFPMNVHKATMEARKLAGSDRAKFVLVIIFLAYVGVAIFVTPYFTVMGLPAWIPITIETLVFMALGVFIFRIFIVKEDEKMQEYDNSESDSFSRFFALRNVTSGEVVNMNGMPVPIFEFDNGTFTLVVRLRLGSNSAEKSHNTKMAMENVYNVIGKYGLDFNQFTMPEDFNESPEVVSYLDQLKAKPVEQTQAAVDFMIEALRVSAGSSVDILYLQIRTRTNFQRYELDTMLVELMNPFRTTLTAYRHIDFLNVEDFMGFLREFYGLGVVDLSMIKISDGDMLRSSLGDHVTVYAITTSDGRVLAPPEDKVALSLDTLAKRLN